MTRPSSNPHPNFHPPLLNRSRLFLVLTAPLLFFFCWNTTVLINTIYVPVEEGALNSCSSFNQIQVVVSSH